MCILSPQLVALLEEVEGTALLEGIRLPTSAAPPDKMNSDLSRAII